MYWFDDLVVEEHAAKQFGTRIENLKRRLHPNGDLDFFEVDYFIRHQSDIFLPGSEPYDAWVKLKFRSDQMHVIKQFWTEVVQAHEKRTERWHREMKPWVVKLQEMAIQAFAIENCTVDPESTRVFINQTNSSYVGDYHIRIGHSFYLRLPCYGCNVEHKGEYPNVFWLEDNKYKVFSARAHLSMTDPEEFTENMENIQKQPRKSQEFRKWEKIEWQVWNAWEEEMRKQGVAYWRLYEGN